MKWAEKGAAASKVSAANAQQQDALRTELWPVSLGLRMVGALPISTNRHTGEHTFRVLSFALVLSVLEYAGILVALGFVHSAEIAQLRSESFDRAVPVLLNVLFDLLVVAAPLFYWLEARALAAHLTEWTRLQAEFEYVTGTRLRLGLRRRATALTCGVCAGSLCLEAWYAQQMPGPFDPAMMATSFFQDLLRNFLCARWHLHCKALVAVSRQTLAQLQLEAAHAHGTRVLQYRLLWLRLSAQTRDMGTACCYTHGFFLGYLFVTLMLAIYQSATGARSLDQNSISLVEGGIIACCVYVFCDSAHRATAHVGAEWVAFLLRVRASSSREVRTQMGDFLETCAAYAPHVTLGDYVVVNRSLLVSMTSAMITYLVVLVQFKMASDGDGSGSHSPNATDSSGTTSTAGTDH